MAWIIGGADPDEVRELRRRGWNVESAKSLFPSGLGFGDDDIAVFVDSDVFAIMSGPDWDKGEAVDETKPARA